MGEQKPYYDFGEFLKKHFSEKVQKIAINAGFTCPNRDGLKGTGGCTYCNNQTFNPDYCQPELTVTQQLEKGKQFFARKYPEMKYLAYFQAYTNTYAELPRLTAMYEEALAVPDVVGIIIGTRPDCMPDSLLDYERKPQTMPRCLPSTADTHGKTPSMPYSARMPDISSAACTSFSDFRVKTKPPSCAPPMPFRPYLSTH